MRKSLKKFTLNPIVSLLFWLMAAFVLIWTGPIFFPIAGSTTSFAALLWKFLGVSVALVINLWLLRRVPGVRVLGLRPSRRNLGLLIVGTVAGGLLVGLWLASFRLLMPFHLTPGTIPAWGLLSSLCIYVLGALLEELAFRGHALIRLRERYGAVAAVLLVSLAFGILHLPGMTGANVSKIIVLTGLSSVLFCLAYLSSASLWTAVGLHAGMNFMLHSIFGAGGGSGPALFRPVYLQVGQIGYDPAFWTLILVQLLCALGLLLAWRGRATLPQRRSR